MRKITSKKSFKNAKMSHFENFLFSSKRVQIEFQDAEKIAIEQMNPNSKIGKSSQGQFFNILKNQKKVVFLAVLKKVKKWILRDILSRKAFMNF